MKRLLIPLLLATATLTAAAPASAADAYPTRPVTLVVPFPPGGPTDDGAPPGRKLRQPLNQNVIVENRAGAGGNIGSEYVAHAKPDGYTILFGTSGPLAINISLYKNQGYDPEKASRLSSASATCPTSWWSIPRCPRPTCRR